MKVPRPRGTTVTIRGVSAGMLDIHSTFSHLYRNDRKAFDFKFLGRGGNRETLHDFWSEVVRRKDPRLLGHPMCGRPDLDKQGDPILPPRGRGPSHQNRKTRVRKFGMPIRSVFVSERAHPNYQIVDVFHVRDQQNKNTAGHRGFFLRFFCCFFLFF